MRRRFIFVLIILLITLIGGSSMAINLSDSYKKITWDIGSELVNVDYFGAEDDSGRGLRIKLVQNSALITPTTETLRVYCINANGDDVFMDGVPDGDHYNVKLTNQVYKKAGIAKAILQLNVEGEWISSSIFGIKVSDNLVDGSILSSNDFIALQNALANVDYVKEQLVLKANQSALDTTNGNVAANTANIATQTSQIASLASGSPKGTYATLTALQTAYPTGTTGIYIVSATGHWYYWNGSAWTDGGVYQSAGIANKSISLAMLGVDTVDFIANPKNKIVSVVSGKNIFNKQSGYQNTALNSDGTTQSNQTNWYTSDFIVINPSTAMSISKARFVAQYDANRTFIAGTYQNVSPEAAVHITTNALTAYIRFTTNNSNLSTAQIELGANSTEYEAYRIVDLKDAYGNELTVDNVVNNKYETKAGGKNLFNRLTVHLSSTLNTDGSIYTNPTQATWMTSEFIGVGASTNLSLSKARFVVEYDKYKNFISGTYVSNASDNETHITTSSSTAFIRFTTHSANINIVQVEVGSASTIYESYYYGLYVDNAKVYDLSGKIENDFLKLLVDNVLCIGDSITDGAYYGGTYDGASIKENYPYMLAKISGWTVDKKSHSGYSASDWWINFNGTVDFTNYDTVVICLGTNNGLTDTLSVDVVGTDYNNFANTETGYYCKIVASILAQNANCHIFLSKVFASKGDVAITNKVIDEIAVKYSCGILDDTASYGNAIIHPFGNDVHYGKVGNVFRAKTFYEQILQYINNNQTKYETLLDE